MDLRTICALRCVMRFLASALLAYWLMVAALAGISVGLLWVLS